MNWELLTELCGKAVETEAEERRIYKLVLRTRV